MIDWHVKVDMAICCFGRNVETRGGTVLSSFIWTDYIELKL